VRSFIKRVRIKFGACESAFDEIENYPSFGVLLEEAQLNSLGGRTVGIADCPTVTRWSQRYPRLAPHGALVQQLSRARTHSDAKKQQRAAETLGMLRSSRSKKGRSNGSISGVVAYLWMARSACMPSPRGAAAKAVLSKSK